MATQENIVGNIYDKYNASNPIAAYMMRNFLASLLRLYRSTAAIRVLEVGCGEGELIHYLSQLQNNSAHYFEGCDLSLDKVPENHRHGITYREASIYQLPYDKDEFDLVICCEVLEHLENPTAGLAELARVTSSHVIVSTPWEPIWRLLNCGRGKYLSALGNTPGHIQHFTRGALKRLFKVEFNILQVETPLPWTMLLGNHRE